MSDPAAPIDIRPFLPDSLNLPPHLSAHKYFFVCTLTVAAWDTLVLSPRTWRLLRTPSTRDWPLLKIIYHTLRLLMPAEFIVVAVAFFDTNWKKDRCEKFYLFEPIVTAVLLAMCGAAHSIRLSAIYDQSTAVLGALGAGVVAMIGAMATGAAFHRPMPLLDGQGCIAGPKHTWVGIYWAASTIFFIASFALALTRSVQSLQVKPLGWWKLMLRDGLNLYGAIALVHLVNVLFWFIAKADNDADTIKTIVTSMTAVLTVTMTLRIILNVRGSLAGGGAYAGMSTTGSGSRAGTTHVISTRGGSGPAPIQPQSFVGGAAGRGSAAQRGFSLDEIHAKPEREWDGSSREEDRKDQLPLGTGGVKVHVERETVDAPYGNYYKN